MKILRPIRHSDLDGLERIAQTSGCGFTSLPADRSRLAEKIASAQRSFCKQVTSPQDEQYLFVLEDTTSGDIIGTTGIAAKVGQQQPLYHFKVHKDVYHSRELDYMNQVDSLQVCTDYSGVSEICSLFLDQNHRTGFTGKFLSRCRFLFMASHPQRFANTIIAEMRGMSTEQGDAPFFHWLEKNFLPMSFSQASLSVGRGDVAFIPELMPSYPIYACLLDERARQTIGKVHPHTAPALKLLKREGFAFKGYIDLFDGGPTVEASLANILSVRQSRLCDVMIGVPDPLQQGEQTLAISNLGVADFCAGFTDEAVYCGRSQTVTLPFAVADKLRLTQGEQVRVLPL